MRNAENRKTIALIAAVAVLGVVLIYARLSTKPSAIKTSGLESINSSHSSSLVSGNDESTAVPSAVSLQRIETLDRLTEAGIPTIQFGNTQVPIFGGGEPFVWSLLSLLVSVFSSLAALFMVLKIVAQRNQAGTIRENPFVFIPILFGTINFIAFFISYNLSGIMILIDTKTILFILLLAAEFATYFVFQNKNKQKEA